MRVDLQYPWDIPVPVRGANFLSLFPAHNHCNIATDMARIGSFGVRRHALPPEQLLFVDQQAVPFLQMRGRLGSGRSGVYRGLYLKGVGRTPLAGNWNSPDINHNSGHLTASSAIREYVVSAYMRAVGGERSIVPCQGVLLRSISPHLGQFRPLLAEEFPEDALPAADAAIQAITVKPGPFSRISNFAWLLHHLTPRCVQESNSLSWFARLLAGALADPYCGLASHLCEISPGSLVSQLEGAVNRACKHFELWLNLGVWWGSFGNNFTLDGRFLDLETPSVSGGPFLGQFSSEGVLDGRVRRSSMIGTEVFFYLTQMQRFCRILVQVLSCLPPLFHPVEREFARELANEIDLRLLGSDSVLGSRGRAVELALGFHEGASPWLSHAARVNVRKILEREYDWIVGDGIYSGSRAAEQGVPLVIPPIISEAGVKWTFRAIPLGGHEVIAPAPEAQGRAWSLHSLIAELDATTDVDTLLSKLGEVERRVQSLVARAAVSPFIGDAVVGRNFAAPVSGDLPQA